MVERELKAVVPTPSTVKASLALAGARLRFQGQMVDRRFDRAGELAVRDEVLRIRAYLGTDGSTRIQVAWKGPPTVEDGHKLRDEHECDAGDLDAAIKVFGALGYRPVHQIDRYVEYYEVGAADVRLEWYPRMDVLVEVEGSAVAIEQAVAVLGLGREQYLTDSLAAFVGRYEARTGRQAAVSLAELGDDEPSWAGVR